MNVSNTNNTQRDWKPSTPIYEVILWCIIYSLTAVGIICANVFAVYVFTMKRLLRKRSNILLLNLATADLMVGGIAFPMYIYIFYNSHKSFLWKDMIANHVYLGVDIFSGLSSMFILAVIALERAYSVYRPLKHRCVSRRSRLYWSSAACVWMTSGVLTSLKILTSLGVVSSSYDKHVIFMFVSIALVTIMAAHVSIWTKITIRKENLDFIVKEKSVALAMLLVTVAFIVMWLPFYLLNVIYSFDQTVLKSVPLNFFYFAKLLQYGNSVVNPVIYTLKLPQFRRALRRLQSFKTSTKTDREVPL